MSKASGLIDPRYCCCAVPLVNAGIYAVILEQGVVALGIGITAIAAPSVVGASFASFGAYILAAVCLVVAAIQPIGWIGVLREKTSTFKAFAWANALAVAAAFSVAAALIITSATRHDIAVADCKTDFYTASANSTSSEFASASNTTLTVQAEKICPPLIWAQVGIMGGLWLILLLVQAYFLYLTKSYSTSQVSDHKLYHSVYSENPEAFTMSVLRSTRYNPNSVYSARAPQARDDTWDARPSVESLRDDVYQKPGAGQGYDGSGQGEPREMDDTRRYEDAYAEGSQAYPNHQDGYGQQYPGQPGQQGYGYGHHQQESYDHGQGHAYGGGDGYNGHGGYAAHGYGDDAPAYEPQHPQHPQGALSRDAGDTPVLNQYSDVHGQGQGWGAGHEGVRRPEDVRGHPAEGMFGRKSPRIG